MPKDEYGYFSRLGRGIKKWFNDLRDKLAFDKRFIKNTAKMMDKITKAIEEGKPLTKIVEMLNGSTTNPGGLHWRLRELYDSQVKATTRSWIGHYKDSVWNFIARNTAVDDTTTKLIMNKSTREETIDKKEKDYRYKACLKNMLLTIGMDQDTPPANASWCDILKIMADKSFVVQKRSSEAFEVFTSRWSEDARKAAGNLRKALLTIKPESIKTWDDLALLLNGAITNAGASNALTTQSNTKHMWSKEIGGPHPDPDKLLIPGVRKDPECGSSGAKFGMQDVDRTKPSLFQPFNYDSSDGEDNFRKELVAKTSVRRFELAGKHKFMVITPSQGGNYRLLEASDAQFKNYAQEALQTQKNAHNQIQLLDTSHGAIVPVGNLHATVTGTWVVHVAP